MGGDLFDLVREHFYTKNKKVGSIGSPWRRPLEGWKKSIRVPSIRRSHGLVDLYTCIDLYSEPFYLPLCHLDP